MNGPCILVTGGAGYIGSHTCKLMAKNGLMPVVFDNLSRGHRDFVKWGPLEAGDICDRQRLVEVMTAWRPVAVVHFAALAYVAESMEHPGRYYDTNVHGTVELLEAMRETGVPQLVFSSSCATFGTSMAMPIAEDAPQRPINPYGASKLMVERILADFGAAHGLRSTILRYFNAVGADPDGEIGERHNPEPHILPLLIDTALGRRDRFSIFGDDYATPDGTCVRDYVHVNDLGDAHIRALRHLLKGGSGDAFNLGSGQGVSVRDLINCVEQVTDRPIPTELRPRRPGDPPVLVADATKAARVLGWKPRFDIATSIQTALSWHQKGEGEA
ncbi:MAG: UDP-glucose 4-epimerase [Rhodospirillaceae bacterium BRH_c57]|nr:MAG: UDP-glucose 4-epimerase [Rhodospirillaceae bacterium BRH_c57]